MLKRILVVLFGAGLFVFILTKVDLASTWGLLSTANPWLCLAGFTGLVSMVYLKGVRWSYLLKMQGHSYSVWSCFLIYMGSLFWGNVTPGRAGDFMKVLYLKEDLGLSMGAGMTSILVDRVFDLYILLILGSLGLALNHLPIDPRLTFLVWLFFGLLVAVSILALNRKIGGLLIDLVFQKVLRNRFRDTAQQAFRDFHQGMESFYSPSLLVPALLSFASYALFFWSSSWMANALGLKVDILYLSFCLSVVNIVSLFSFLGMGTREGTLILLFGLIGIGKPQALAYSLLIFFVGTVLFSILCFLCYLAKPIRWKGKMGESPA